jgi:hypothetical protein
LVLNPLRVVVIGGGAAGFFGAITCANAHPHTQVTLLEAGRQPLSKVRISGGGRCNVTHACFDLAELVQYYPRGGKALRGAFSRFQPKDTVAWFGSHGVQLKTEADGRMFPVTDNSETIVNCLVKAAEDAGVKLRTGSAVKSVKQHLPPPPTPHSPLPTQGGFEIELKTGEILNAIASFSQQAAIPKVTTGQKIMVIKLNPLFPPYLPLIFQTPVCKI